jgi:hypothetical protein
VEALADAEIAKEAAVDEEIVVAVVVALAEEDQAESAVIRKKVEPGFPSQSSDVS